MDKRWTWMAALTASVMLSACGGGSDSNSNAAPVDKAQPSNLSPADPVASAPAPADLVAQLQSWVASQPASPPQSGALFLDATPGAGAFTVLGPNWLSGVAHQISFGVRGQVTSDATAAVSVLPSTPTMDLFGDADLIIGRIDGDVKVGGVAAPRQFSYVVAKPASSLPSAGTVSYSLSQATAGDVRVSGSTQPAAAKVTITAASLSADFALDAKAPVTLTLSGTLGDKSYSYSLPVGPAAAVLDRGASSFKADNGSGTVVEGVFAGSNGAEVGVHYTITIDGGSLDGSLILKRP